MAHGIDIIILSRSPTFWNYVMSEARDWHDNGHLIGNKVNPSWSSPAIQELEASDIAGCECLTVAEIEGLTVSYAFMCGSYKFSSRGFQTGVWQYFKDVSRACPDAEITICEWFFETDHNVEKVTLKNGRIIAHYFMYAAVNFEIYQALVWDCFNIEEFECQSCWDMFDVLVSDGKIAQCEDCAGH